MSFADQITALAIPDTNTAAFDPPRFNWHNGIKQVKTPGNFYAKQNEFAEGLGTPWVADSRFENEAGFTTPALKIAVLAWRQQPLRKTKTAEGRDQVQYFLKWEEGMTFHTEVLCMIEGFSGAAVWSMKGTTGAAVTRRNRREPIKQGLLWNYIDGLLKEASRIAKRGLPTWTFWLPIATKLAGDKIAYEDTGYGSFVTPPALHLPANAMDTLFVGQELLTLGEDLLREHHGWAEKRRPTEDTIDADYSVSESLQIAAPRNVPQPVEADEADTY